MRASCRARGPARRPPENRGANLRGGAARDIVVGRRGRKVSRKGANDFYWFKIFFNGAAINRGNRLCYIVFKVRKTDRCKPWTEDCPGTVVTEADGKAHEIYMSGADIGGGQPVDAEVPFCQGD